jgi:uncharacterized protein (DUF2141 family)
MGVLLAVSSLSLMAQTLNIKIENIRNSKGRIYLGFFRDNPSFQEEKPFLEKRFSKDSVENGSLSVQVTIPQGLYGIVLLDDENNNDLMEYNWLGIPREGFGFSDFYLKGFRRPVFSDFDFIMTDSNKYIRIVIRYM